MKHPGMATGASSCFQEDSQFPDNQRGIENECSLHHSKNQARYQTEDGI